MAYELTDRMQQSLVQLSDDDALCPQEQAAIRMAMARIQELEAEAARLREAMIVHAAEQDRLRESLRETADALSWSHAGWKPSSGAPPVEVFILWRAKEVLAGAVKPEVECRPTA